TKLMSRKMNGFIGPAELVLSSDGKTLARRFPFMLQIELIDTQTGARDFLSAGPATSIRALAFSPHGKYLAASDTYATKLWDLARGGGVKTFTWGLPCDRLAFSPDGKVLACGENTGIRVYNVPDGTLLHVLDPKTKRMDSIAFSPDGGLLAA